MRELEALVERYGRQNVENACIFIASQMDRQGIALPLEYTPERIARVLSALWGDALPETTGYYWEKSEEE